MSSAPRPCWSRPAATTAPSSIVLTARKLAPKLNISVTIRVSDNEDIARQAGADTVINPVSFAGLLLASSLQGPHRADYLADLATSEGRVELRERLVEPHEVGCPPAEICTGQPVRLIRDGEPVAPTDPGFKRLAPATGFSRSSIALSRTERSASGRAANRELGEETRRSRRACAQAPSGGPGARTDVTAARDACRRRDPALHSQRIVGR